MCFATINDFGISFWFQSFIHGAKLLIRQALSVPCSSISARISTRVDHNIILAKLLHRGVPQSTEMVFSARCNIYISRLSYDVCVRLSVHLSVTALAHYS